jgi:hypothetical protein
MSDGGHFLSSPSSRLALALALGLLLLVAVVLLRGRGARWIFAAAFLPPPLVALFSRQFDFVGWHAFMHASPIYQIMARGGAPEDPLYAGGPLRYPWAEFWLTATAARWTGANPLVLTLIAQSIAYLVFIAAAAWLAASLTNDRVTIALAAFLSAFGISIAHAGPLAEPLQRALSVWLETRVVPLDKFLSVTAMPIGYAAMLVASAAGVDLAARDDERRANVAWIAGGTLVAVFIHPLSWLGILVIVGVSACVLLVSRPPGVWRRLLGLALAVAIPSLLALPYLRSVGTSESSQGSIGLTPSLALLGDKAVDLGVFLAVFLLLAYVERAQLLQRVRARDRATIVLLGSIGALSLAYLSVSAPGRNEYKFLLQLAPPAAAFLAIWLRSLLRRHRELTFVLLFLLVLPGANLLGIRPWFEVTDPAQIVGQYQRALDPSADALYQWVADQTPSNAVFIAADLRMPPLGRRSLYIAVDAPWVGRDGWGLARNSLLQWHVRRPDADMYRRQSLATIVLSPSWSAPAQVVMREIQSAVPGRELYVHSQSRPVSAKLDATPGFVLRFSNGAGNIYQWLGAPTTAR